MSRALCLLVAVAVVGCGRDEPARAPERPRGRRVAVEVGATGYVPNTLTAASGERIVLVFTRTADVSCGQYVQLRDRPDTSVALPLNTPVELGLTMPATGDIVFQCHMDMLHGIVSVR